MRQPGEGLPAREVRVRIDPDNDVEEVRVNGNEVPARISWAYNQAPGQEPELTGFTVSFEEAIA